MEELFEEFNLEAPKIMAMIGRMKTQVNHMAGTIYLPREIAGGYIDALNLIQSAISWLALPVERVEVKMRKPTFEVGRYYHFPESDYTPIEE